MPVDFDGAGFSLTAQVVMAEQVEDLLTHPGFEALSKALELHGEGLLAQVIYRKPDYEAASYADPIGHLRGLREIEPIARGIVENGKQAAAEMRRREES